MVAVVDVPELHREDAVNERAQQRVREDAGVRRLEAEDEDAVEGDRHRREDREAAGRSGGSSSRAAVGCGRTARAFQIRAPVSTWTTASTAAAVADQALNAIGVEKTAVTMSVYVDSTLANMSRRACYDRSMSRRTRLLVPAVLLTVVVGSVYALAELHLAKDEVAAAPEPWRAARRRRVRRSSRTTAPAATAKEAAAAASARPWRAAGPRSTRPVRSSRTEAGAMPAGLVEGEDLGGARVPRDDRAMK